MGQSLVDEHRKGIKNNKKEGLGINFATTYFKWWTMSWKKRWWVQSDCAPLQQCVKTKAHSKMEQEKNYLLHCWWCSIKQDVGSFSEWFCVSNKRALHRHVSFIQFNCYYQPAKICMSTVKTAFLCVKVMRFLSMRIFPLPHGTNIGFKSLFLLV